MHVGHLDELDGAALAAERDRTLRLVGVHVHAQGRLAADDEDRVAELLELALEHTRVERFALDDEARAEAKTRELVADRLERRGLRRRRAAATRETAHELDEPRRAGVDDARLAQDRQQLARPRHARVAAGEDRVEIAARLGLLRELANRRQHRSARTPRRSHGAAPARDRPTAPTTPRRRG